MIEETGTVVETEPGFVTVRFTRTDACKKCGACRNGSDNAMLMRLRDDSGVAVGETVSVELPDGKLIHAGLLAYGVPLLGLTGGIFFGYYVLAGLLNLRADITGFATGILLMGISYLVLRLTERKRAESGHFLPHAQLKRHEFQIEKENE